MLQYTSGVQESDNADSTTDKGNTAWKQWLSCLARGRQGISSMPWQASHDLLIWQMYRLYHWGNQQLQCFCIDSHWFFYMPAGPTLRERQAGLLWAQNGCILYSMQYAAFVNWVLVSYTLPNQLSLSPSDLDSALWLLIHRPLCHCEWLKMLSPTQAIHIWAEDGRRCNNVLHWAFQ